MDVKKKNISLRVSQQDLDRVKLISARMQVKESDLIRFAIKQVLNSLVPLQEESYKGTDLLPVLIEMGPELTSFFELSCADLDQIINGTSRSHINEVELDDLRLISLFGANQEYAKVKLSQSMPEQAVADDGPLDLKRYLEDKYFSSKTAQSSCSEGHANTETIFAEVPKGALKMHVGN